MPEAGEVGIKIAPVIGQGAGDGPLAGRIDALLRRTCTIARVLTGSDQAALKLWADSDPGQARKYFSLGEKYGAFRDFRVDPRGIGLHGMHIAPGVVVRLTQAEVLHRSCPHARARSRLRRVSFELRQLRYFVAVADELNFTRLLAGS
jgi:hypothetical protein